MSFQTDLWDSVDTVCAHMHHVRDFTKEMVGYYEERVKIEQRYVKDLGALSKKITQGETMDSLRESWLAIKKETESTAAAHNSYATLVQATMVDSLNGWRESYKRLLESIENDVARFNKEYQNLQALWKKAMQNYIGKCKAADKAHMEYSSAPTPEKKLKLWPYFEVAEKQALVADEEYRQSIKAVRSGRDAYQQSIGRVLADTQQAEGARIKLMKDLFQRTGTSSLSLSEVVRDQATAALAVVGRTSADADLQAFIAGRRSGKQHPPHVEYEPVQWVGSAKQGGDMKPGLSPAVVTGASSPAAPKSGEQMSTVVMPTLGASPRVSGVTTPTAAPVAAAPVAAAAPAAIVPQEVVVEERYTAVYDYAAAEENELSFSAGAVLLVSSKDDSGWWTGRLDGSAEVGVFPAAYVQSEDATQADAAAAAGADAGAAADEYEVLGRVKAVYDYAPQQGSEGELALTAGEVLEQLSAENEGWIFGRNSGGQTGSFPATYVEPC